MDRFEYRAGELWCEDIRATEIAARFDTPLYVYSRDTLLTHFERVRSAFAELDPLICYSIKCCQNLHILKLLRDAGSGFDVVSGGELARALQAAADPGRIVFAGVGKSEAEIAAGIEAGIGLFNVESESELQQLAAAADAAGKTVRAALRVNPDVDPRTHTYTTTGKKETKFGVDLERARAAFKLVPRNAKLHLCGIHLHIGSPVNDIGAYVSAIEKANALIDLLRADGHTIDTFDVGGGFGAYYTGGEAPPAIEYARAIVPLLRGRGLKIILEPGRSIAGNAGIVLTRVLHVKSSGERRFIIVDASMNELIRPALYGAYHFIWPVAAGDRAPQGRSQQQPYRDLVQCDVVGPVCESGDFLAKERLLPRMERGDLIAIFTAGAYGMVMSSQYNSRPRAAEVLVDRAEARLIRRRETFADLIACELL
jgi:diaminopimelate decarboxylase